jgi:hypothetical protein
MRKAAWVVMFVLVVLSASGCFFRAGGSLAVPTPPSATVTVGAAVAPPPPVVVGAQSNVIHATVVAPTPTFAANVQVLGTTCNPGAAEVLNGIDDNCNGQIDEGWVQSGTLQITLGWATGADLDLYVVEPNGNQIYYGQTQSSSGGYLDRDARGVCTDGQTGENIYWTGGPPGGHYIVQVNYYEADACNVGPTTFVVSVAFNGEIVGAYQYTIGFGDTVNVVEFDL